MKLDVGDEDPPRTQTIEKWFVKKTDREKWEKVTNEKYESWPPPEVDTNDIESLHQSFMQIFTECMLDAVPRKQVTVSKRRKKPPWWNEQTAETKQSWNSAKKQFRRRSTPQLFKQLKEKELEYDRSVEIAKESWVAGVCTKLNLAASPKDIWQCFRQLTSYQEEGGTGVLPLRKKDGSYEFDSEERPKILEDALL